jgi:TetR/AcrR family transcriptional repressor of nem operon
LVYTVRVNVKHDKEKVLSKGIELFWSKGYNSLGVAEICETTGMTKGAFYNAFESKENFLLEGIKSYGDSSAITQQALLSSGGDKAIDRLQNFYDKMFNFQSKMNYRGCLVVNMVSELSTEHPTVRKAVAIELDRFIANIEPIVREAQEAGDLKSDIDSVELTKLIHSTFMGTLTRAKSLKSNVAGKKTMKLLINSLSK